MAVYFVQGVLGLASLARAFYFKDVLHLPPAEVAALQGITVLPWTIKPIYGFFSDTVVHPMPGTLFPSSRRARQHSQGSH